MKCKAGNIYCVITMIVLFSCAVTACNHNENVNENDYEGQIRLYTEKVIKNPKDAVSLIKRAAAYNNKTEYDLALEDSNKAIELKPKHPDAYYNRGLAYAGKGFYDVAFYDLAIVAFNKAIELKPKDPDVYYNRGLAYAGKTDYPKAKADNAKAIDDFNKAIELKPKNPDAYYNRGLAYARRADYTNAIADFNKAIELGLQHPDVYYNRGLAYAEEADYAKTIADFNKVIADFNKAIGLGLQHPDVYYNRGLAYVEKADYTKAIADFNKVIELEPEYPGAKENIKQAEKLAAQQRLEAEKAAAQQRAIEQKEAYLKRFPEIDWESWYGEYYNNKVRAEQNWQGKTVVIRGLIRTIDKNRISIEDKKNSLFSRYVYCSIAGSDLRKIPNLSKGDKIIIKGTVDRNSALGLQTLPDLLSCTIE